MSETISINTLKTTEKFNDFATGQAWPLCYINQIESEQVTEKIARYPSAIQNILKAFANDQLSVNSNSNIDGDTFHNLFYKEVSLCPNNKWLYALTNKGAFIWDTTRNSTQPTLKLTGHHKYVTTQVNYSPDNKLLITQSIDAKILWDVSQEKPQALYNDPINKIISSPSGTRVLIDSNSSATIWNADGHEFKPYSFINTGKKNLQEVLFSPSENTLLIIDKYNRNARVWNLPPSI